jgi:hypothetical protein
LRQRGNSRSLFFDQGAKLLRDFVLFLFQGLDHAGGDALDGLDFVAPRDEVFFVMADDTRNLVISGGFLEFLEDLGIVSLGVVIDGHGLEVGFDHFDERGM